MILNDWLALTADAQQKLLISWIEKEEWDKYQGIANKAATALKNDLSGIPEVTNVQTGGGKAIHRHPICPGIKTRELILEVCTVLHGEQQLNQVPPTYAGFSVHQLNLGDKRRPF